MRKIRGYIKSRKLFLNLYAASQMDSSMYNRVQGASMKRNREHVPS